METAEITIWYAKDENFTRAYFEGSGWIPADLSETHDKVFQRTMTIDVEKGLVGIAERFWRAFNIVEGTEYPVLVGIRSMSVGDVIDIGGARMACLPQGWEQIHE